MDEFTFVFVSNWNQTEFIWELHAPLAHHSAILNWNHLKRSRSMMCNLIWISLKICINYFIVYLNECREHGVLKLVNCKLWQIDLFSMRIAMPFQIPDPVKRSNRISICEIRFWWHFFFIFLIFIYFSFDSLLINLCCFQLKCSRLLRTMMESLSTHIFGGWFHPQVNWYVWCNFD